MELLVIISHPSQLIRPVDSIMADLVGVYDGVYGQASQRHHRSFPHATVILLTWGQPPLGWQSWYEDGQGVLATVGLPLLYCPPGCDSAMITPDRLTKYVLDAKRSDLGYCGGYYAVAHTDQTGVIHLATNYLAEVPLYRANRNGVTVWSNKATAAGMLAGIAPKLDRQAVAEFITLSHCLENRTLLEGVETEPPARCIVIGSQGHQFHDYLDLPTAYFAHRQPKQQTATEVVSAMEPLVDAMSRADEEVRIHLSGGQDSRAVAALCRHHGLRPLCLTHNTPNDEVPSAKRLAAYLGMSYRTIDGSIPSWQTFQHQAVQSLWQSGGMMSLKYMAGLYDLTYIRDEGYLPVEGFGGEYGRGYYVPNAQVFDLVNQGDLSILIAKAVKNQANYWPHPAIDNVKQAIERIVLKARDQGLGAFETCTWFYANQRARRWAVTRRNTGWGWFVDPLMMPCWIYPGMSADPQDQRDDALIRALIDTAWPGTTKVPTVPELAYAARRRRVASNRIVRIAMRWYDRLRGPDPKPVPLQTLQILQPKFREIFRQAQDHLGGIVTTDQVDRWLNVQPMTYIQTELFWNSLTIAMWCGEFLTGHTAISPCQINQENLDVITTD